MRWIGIDLGSQAIGFAVVEREEQGFVGRHSEALILPSRPIEERLREIYSWLRERLGEWLPAQAVAIEEPFLGRNVSSALILGTMKGLLWGLLLERGEGSLLTLSPAEVKRTITGRAHASKEQVATMLQYHLRWEGELPTSDHATDAIAIALAAAYNQNSPITRRLTKRAER